MKRSLLSGAVLAAMVWSLAPASASEDKAAESPAPKGRETCINLRLVEQTTILDDRNIVYRMRGGKLYLNTLPTVCGGLFDQGNYLFQAHNPYRICRGDSFQVFRVLTGCKLGYFDPLTKEKFSELERERTAARAGHAKADKSSN